MNMKVNSVRHLLVLGAILCLTPITFVALSQSKESQEKGGKTVTITGCIAKGESADEFAITQNGNKYGLKSTKVKLADHLGHKVTVIGKFTRAPGEGEEGEKAEQGGGEYADLQVTSLKMISTSCQ
jgi:hypothetical protein